MTFKALRFQNFKQKVQMREKANTTYSSFALLSGGCAVIAKITSKRISPRDGKALASHLQINALH